MPVLQSLHFPVTEACVAEFPSPEPLKTNQNNVPKVVALAGTRRPSFSLVEVCRSESHGHIVGVFFSVK